jgi:hypothetical protein
MGSCLTLHFPYSDRHLDLFRLKLNLRLRLPHHPILRYLGPKIQCQRMPLKGSREVEWAMVDCRYLR